MLSVSLWHGFLTFFIVITSLIYYGLRKRYSYWAERGVVHEKPVWFYGNVRGLGSTKPLHQPIHELYMKYRNVAPFGGFYLVLRRAAVIFDLDLVKTILIKDFANFPYRGNYYNEEDDPLSAHIVNLDGPKWRKMRHKLTPTFTSGRMKFMFPTLVEVADRFVVVLMDLVRCGEQNIEKNKNDVKKIENDSTLDSKSIPKTLIDDFDNDSIEMHELLARFTTDVIGNCAFGLECNSLKDPNTKFRLMGKKAFASRRHGTLISSMMNAFPDFARKLHLKSTPDDINEFFMGVVRETVEYRERSGIQRKDFMNMLIEMKNEEDGLTIEEIAAQAFVFFLAGFETSSSTLSFCLYELAVNQHVQEKARQEIMEMYERHDDKLTYEGIKELKYLQQVFYETLRLYPIATFLLRKALDDYAVPHTNHTIEKGTNVIVPIEAIHRDPKIYNNPNTFDPERFNPEEVEKRHPMSWLPFGEGPRNCIGLRFGEMQAIVGLVVLLKHFRFLPGRDTKIPIEINVKSFLLSSKGGVRLRIECIE